eukprot:2555337-Rhodomonas_salina.1
MCVCSPPAAANPHALSPKVTCCPAVTIRSQEERGAGEGGQGEGEGGRGGEGGEARWKEREREKEREKGGKRGPRKPARV